MDDALPPAPISEPPDPALAALRAVVEAHEAACLADVHAVLARYGCELYADWDLVLDEAPRYRIGVRLAQWERPV